MYDRPLLTELKAGFISKKINRDEEAYEKSSSII